MNSVIIIIAAICIFGAVMLAFFNNLKTDKIMTSLEKMVKTASEGTFAETAFDESKLSALETEFADYLRASELSAKNVVIEKNRIKELTSDISHQTKTPIANLMLYSELLLETDLDVEAHAYVEAIHMQSEKMRFLIDSLVKLSRLEADVFVLSPKEHKLQPMLEELSSQYRASAKQKGLCLNIDSSEAKAVFDMKWTTEAIGNIIDNAVKYTHRGGITISVIPYTMFTCVSIKDTGIGIPENEKACIFTRFYRSESVRNVEGIGVGLYLTRQILSKEGGYIKVDSHQGKGSCFEVYLPNE